MSDTKVGVLIPEGAQRDAIHVAIAPVIAGQNLNPGEHVGFITPDGKVGCTESNNIGIIDPFLATGVREGGRCWLFLYPGTVTGMKHHWSHPAFTLESDRAVSEAWLREYSLMLNPYDEENPELAFQNLISGLRIGEICARGSDLHSFCELDSPELLKHHAERLLGISINWEHFSFSCSC